MIKVIELFYDTLHLDCLVFFSIYHFIQRKKVKKASVLLIKWKVIKYIGVEVFVLIEKKCHCYFSFWKYFIFSSTLIIELRRKGDAWIVDEYVWYMGGGKGYLKKGGEKKKKVITKVIVD